MDFENQQMLEHLFNDRQSRPLLLRELDANTQLMSELDSAVESTNGLLTLDFMKDVLIHLMMAKRATVPAVVGIYRFHYATGKGEPCQMTAIAISGMVALGLVYYDDERIQIVVKHEASAATQDLIRQYMYLPPMIVPPLTVVDGSNNRGSGYITQQMDSLLLQDNHHEGELCVDHLNRCNNIPLSISERMVKTLRNQWKNTEAPKGGETFEDYQKRIKAFEQYERDSFLVMALMLEMGNKFYLTHKYDKRGRSYCQGYQINYQGNCYNKAVVELANKELVT